LNSAASRCLIASLHVLRAAFYPISEQLIDEHICDLPRATRSTGTPYDLSASRPCFPPLHFDKRYGSRKGVSRHSSCGTWPMFPWWLEGRVLVFDKVESVTAIWYFATHERPGPGSLKDGDLVIFISLTNKSEQDTNLSLVHLSHLSRDHAFCADHSHLKS